MKNGNHPVTVKRSASGLGLFAREAIAPRQRIIEYTGPLIANDVAEKKRGRYFFGINRKWAIDGSPRTNTARYINHSCRPNAESCVSGKRVWVWSKRSIKAGEEITMHYGEAYFADYITAQGCKCESCFGKQRPK